MKKVLWLVFALLLASSAEGAIYYVATSGGNDGRSCGTSTTIGTPKQTINSGVACLSHGDTLLIRAGTYAEALGNPTLNSGLSWSDKIRIAAYPSETVWLKPADGVAIAIRLENPYSYIEFDGINIDLTNSTTVDEGVTGIVSYANFGAHHIRFQNAEIILNRKNGDTQSSGVGVSDRHNDDMSYPNGFNEYINLRIHASGGLNANYAYYLHTSNNLIENNDIYDTGFVGLQIQNSASPTSSNNVVRNNRIHDITQGMDNRRYGLYLLGDDNLVYNNIIYTITTPGNGVGINVIGDGNLLYNNTIYGVTGDAIAINADNSTFQNNLTYNNTVNGVHIYGGSGTTQDHNLDGVNPTFVNPGAGDFHLVAGSPAIDHGTTVGAVGADFAGISRPIGGVYDIGAYEFGEAPPPITEIAHAAGTTFLSANFTGSNGTNLTAYTGAIGATFAKQTGTTGDILIASNRIRGNDTSGAAYYGSGTPVSAEYDVVGTYHVFSVLPQTFVAHAGHMATGAKTQYQVQYGGTDLAWFLVKWVAGSPTTLAYYITDLVPGTDYIVRLQIRGDAIGVQVDDTAIMYYAGDTAIPGAGKAGIVLINFDEADTDSTGIHIGDIIATDVQTQSASTMCTKCRLRFGR